MLEWFLKTTKYSLIGIIVNHLLLVILCQFQKWGLWMESLAGIFVAVTTYNDLNPKLGTDGHELSQSVNVVRRQCESVSLCKVWRGLPWPQSIYLRFNNVKIGSYTCAKVHSTMGRTQQCSFQLLKLHSRQTCLGLKLVHLCIMVQC